MSKSPSKSPSKSSSKSSSKRKGFTDAEDRLLHELRGEKHLSWEEITKYFPGRSAGTLHTRYHETLGGEYREQTKGPEKTFTAQEDRLLIKLKEVRGMTWDEIAKHFPEHNSGTLQLRYHQYLRVRKARQSQSIKNTFTPDEDRLLVSLREDRKLMWKEIVQYFPGRSSGTLRSRYHRVLRDRTL